MFFSYQKEKYKYCTLFVRKQHFSLRIMYGELFTRFINVVMNTCRIFIDYMNSIFLGFPNLDYLIASK